jgi:hypothetical protein
MTTYTIINQGKVKRVGERYLRRYMAERDYTAYGADYVVMAGRRSARSILAYAAANDTHEFGVMAFGAMIRDSLERGYVDEAIRILGA